MKVICTAFERIESGRTVVFIGNHSDDHAAYNVRLAGPEDYRTCWGTALEAAEPKRSFMVEVDLDKLAHWILTQSVQEHD